MGVEYKGVPRPLDIGQCMKYASEEEVYCLEITGTKSKSHIWDQNPGEKQFFSIEVTKTEIRKYEGHLKTIASQTADKGEKIKIKLEQLYKLLEERQKQQSMGPSTLAKGAEQYSTEGTGHELTNIRFAGQSSASLSCSNKQVLMTNPPGHELGKNSAFNSSNTKMGIAEGSSNVKKSRGQEGKSSCIVSSSSLCANSQDFPRVFKMGLQNSKLPTQVESSSAFKGALGKRHRTFPHLQKDSTSLFIATSPGMLKSTTVHEFASGEKSRLCHERLMHRDSRGASLDTAMELSDDEEKSGAEDKKADFSRKGLLNNLCFVRSNYKRIEGFKVTYPSGDPDAVEVRQSDMNHLDPFEFLNDTVIDFYIKYLQRPEFLSQEMKVHYHFFNTFFFKKLLLEKRKKRQGSSYYSELRKWTKGVDIFAKKYLLVPVHDCAHWSLVIICFAIDHQERDGLTPYILHLDSMKDGHASREVFYVLRSYLENEWNHIRGQDVNDESCTTILKDFVCKRVEVPLQENAWDCGLFLLYFVECFLRDAYKIFKPRLLSSMFGRQWFEPQEASSLRKRVRTVLENLIHELDDKSMEDMD